MVTVRLEDISLAGAPAVVLAEQSITVAVPVITNGAPTAGVAVALVNV